MTAGGPGGYREHMSSSFSDDQLQPDDTLDDRGVDDVLDEGMSPPERPSRAVAHGLTSADDAEGETLDERLEQEEPDPTAAVDHTRDAQEDELLGEQDTDPTDGFEVGDDRTGRLAAAEGDPADAAEDVGVDGAAAGAEEAAVHTVDEDQV
jgi:hypothetical protein